MILSGVLGSKRGATFRTLDASVVMLHAVASANGTLVDATGRRTPSTKSGYTTGVTDSVKGLVTTLNQTMSSSNSARSSYYPQYPSSADFRFGTSEVCVEIMFMLAGGPGTSGNMAGSSYLFSHEYGASQRSWNFALSGSTSTGKWTSLRFMVNSNGGSWCNYGVALTGTDILTPGVWYHAAGVIDRVAGKMRLFLDGKIVAEVDAPTQCYHIYDQPLFIGQSGVNDWEAYLKGSICDVRICKGDAVYRNEFTPPLRLETYKAAAS